jgi:two-component system, OmpR family, phosphate regulon sensor histidine kinase PhoR
MGSENLEQLADLMNRDRDAVLARWRSQVRQLPSARHLDTPTLNDHVPDLLDELASAFKSESERTIQETVLERSPPEHGRQRYRDGFDIVEVVAEYNILRGCIYDLIESSGLTLEGRAFHILNRVLDNSIGLAVQTFATQQALEVQRRREEYLAFVAHDLRTPLNAISLAARLLDLTFAGRRNNADAPRLFKTLQRNVDQIKSLSETVLKESGYLRGGPGAKLECRELQLWPLVESLVYDLAPLAEAANTRVINEIDEDLAVYADASALRRVLQNLLSNSIRHTPRGEVVVSARKEGPGGGIECQVTDNGAGIPKERLKTIFEKLETDSENEGGIGLGLSIVTTFVEAHGGKVSVESHEGVGSTFSFTLPGRETKGAI